MKQRWSALPMRTRLLALAGLAIIAFILICKKAILPTWELRQACLNASVAHTRTATGDSISLEAVIALEAELAALNQLIGNAPPEQIQHQLLKTISEWCSHHPVQLHAFPETHHYEATEVRVSSERVSVKGRFLPILQLVHHLEQHLATARLVGVDCHLQRQRNQHHELYATIYLQHFSALR